MKKEKPLIWALLSWIILLLVVPKVPDTFAVEAGSYDAMMRSAASHCRENRVEPGLERYGEILAAHPGDLDALVGRGFCLLKREGDFSKAEDDFRIVIDRAPAYIDAYYGLALVYKRSGRWQAARQVLEDAGMRNAGDEKALDQLADVCWRTGYMSLARALDKRPAAERTRGIMGYLSELSAYYSYDWVKDQPDWRQVGIDYVSHLRPDLTASASVAGYRRYDTEDSQIGVGINYRHDMNLTIAYDGYFATNRNFLAIQKHHPMVYYAFPSATVLGAGLRLDEYDIGWAEVGRVDVRQYVRRFYGEYSIRFGRDNYKRDVATQIARIGYEMEESLFCHIGYANGDETVELGGGSEFSNQRVESVFFGVKYFIGKTWGVRIDGGPEYRDGRLFRNNATASVFLRF